MVPNPPRNVAAVLTCRTKLAYRGMEGLCLRSGQCGRSSPSFQGLPAGAAMPYRLRSPFRSLHPVPTKSQGVCFFSLLLHQLMDFFLSIPTVTSVFSRPFLLGEACSCDKINYEFHLKTSVAWNNASVSECGVLASRSHVVGLWLIL